MNPPKNPTPNSDENWGEHEAGGRISSIHSTKIACIYCMQQRKAPVHTLKAEKAGEMHILHYQMLDIIHWQSTQGTRSSAGMHLSSSVILSYCCVSTHTHLQTKENMLFLESLTTAVLERVHVYSKVGGNRFWPLKLLTDITFLILKGRRNYWFICQCILLILQLNYYCFLN